MELYVTIRYDVDMVGYDMKNTIQYYIWYDIYDTIRYDKTRYEKWYDIWCDMIWYEKYTI